MVKKLLSGLITASLIISSVVIPVTAEDTSVNLVTEFPTTNLIVNGGFEDGFEGWTVNNPYNLMSVVETFVDDAGATKTAVNGKKAFYVSTPANPSQENVSIGYVEQEIEATANTNYVLNLSWYDAYSTYGSIKVYGDTVSSSNCLATVGNLFSGNAWYSSTCAFNSGEHEKLIVRMEYVYRQGATKYAIDNITLKAAGNTQTIDFEGGYPEDLNIRSTDLAVTTEKAYTGTHSLKFVSGSGYPIANAVFALNPNRHFAVMFWYYIESGKLGAAAKFAHENGWSGYTQSPLASETVTETGEWKRAILTPNDGVTGSLANRFVEIAFQNMAPNTVVYIDNIQCKYYDESVDSITITGNNESGGILHAEAQAYNYGYNFEDPVTYQWQKSDDKKVWTDISGATSQDYILSKADSRKYLRVKVSTSNRYSTDVSDAYYSKSVQVTDISYKHHKGTSCGVELQNEVFSVEDSSVSATFDIVNKTADTLDLKVFVGGYSGNSELVNYSIEECPQVALDASAQISKTFTDAGIDYIRIIVFDADMNTYYAERTKDCSVESAENAISFDKETQEITITGVNNEKPETIIVKDNNGDIEYIDAVDSADKAGYKVVIAISPDAYGKHTVFTSFCPEGYEFLYYSEADYERIITNFASDMDNAKVAEAYQALEVESDLLGVLDIDKLTATVNAHRAEVAGETLEAKMSSAKEILEKALVLEAYNQEASGLTDANGKLVYEDMLGIASIDTGATTFYNIYSTFLTKEGLEKVNAMLCGQNFTSLADLTAQFKKSVILCAIGYPAVNGAGYVAEILTEENMNDAGINHAVYSSRTQTQKAQINEGLIKKVFTSTSALEAEINKALTTPPVGGGGGGGSAGGGGGGGGSSSSSKPQTPMQNINTVINQVPESQKAPVDKVMTFADVNDSHWAYKYIYALKEVGIVGGVDEEHFAPDGRVTREQFVKMLCDAFELKVNEENNNSSFADCQSGAWYERYIKIATSQGIISGIGYGMFGIGRPVTREDLCVMAVRALNDSAEYEEIAFTDADQISDYAKSAVNALAALKVISGFEDGSVRAKDYCTRAQAAKIIYELRAIKEIQQ